MQVKVPRVAYVFVGEIPPQPADNSPKLLHKQAPLLKKPPFRIPNTGFNFWCRTQKETRKHRYFRRCVCFFFCHQNYEGPRPEMTTEMTASSAYPRFTRDESRNHQGGASRMRGCHQTPEGTKTDFSINFSKGSRGMGILYGEGKKRSNFIRGCDLRGWFFQDAIVESKNSTGLVRNK